MRGPQNLLDSEDNWRTRMGAWFPGERVVYRGKDLFEDLKDQRWMGLYLYGITGRFFDDKQLDLFEGIWTLSASFPDSRLWNNRVAALAGSMRSTVTLGTSAAIAVSEAITYGQRACIGAIDFLLRAKQKVDLGADLTMFVHNELHKFRSIPGYGRPIIDVDERIAPLMQLAGKLGFSSGKYVTLAFDIEKILAAGRWRRNLNIAGLAAALTADQGLTPREHNCYLTPCFIAGIIPCLVDGIEKQEGAFLPLRCERIAYSGVKRRVWDIR